MICLTSHGRRCRSRVRRRHRHGSEFNYSGFLIRNRLIRLSNYYKTYIRSRACFGPHRILSVIYAQVNIGRGSCGHKFSTITRAVYLQWGGKRALSL